jgi:hypothetical protein
LALKQNIVRKHETQLGKLEPGTVCITGNIPDRHKLLLLLAFLGLKYHHRVNGRTMHIVKGTGFFSSRKVTMHYNMKHKNPAAHVHTDLNFLAEYINKSPQLTGRTPQEALDLVYEKRYRYVNNGASGFNAEYVSTGCRSSYVYAIFSSEILNILGFLEMKDQMYSWLRGVILKLFSNMRHIEMEKFKVKPPSFIPLFHRFDNGKHHYVGFIEIDRKQKVFFKWRLYDLKMCRSTHVAHNMPHNMPTTTDDDLGFAPGTPPSSPKKSATEAMIVNNPKLERY